MRSFICKILVFFIGILNSVGIAAYPSDKDICKRIVTENYSSGKSCTELSFSFAKSEVNTAEITFDGEKENTIEIYNGDTLIYRRTGTESYRFCAFPTLEAESITIKLSTAAKVKKVSLSCRKSDNSDFRVTAYVVADSVNKEINPAYFDVVTDVILFGTVTFNEKGELNVNRASLEKALSFIKNAVGDREINIYVNVLGPGSAGGDTWNDQMYSLADRHTAAFKNDSLVTAIVDVCSEYDFDGIFFDYEYPLREKDYRQFGKFIAKLDKATDKKLGAALSSWNISVTCREVRSLDMIELMMYDCFDSYGNHSSFTSAVDGFNSIRENFIDTERVDLGIPFYGRPADRSGYWPSYSQFADVLDGTDAAETEYGTSYFNCVQTVYDKTAYALSKGLGGMMVWHFSCDTDINSSTSLFAAMGRCIEDRVE